MSAFAKQGIDVHIRIGCEVYRCDRFEIRPSIEEKNPLICPSKKLLDSAKEIVAEIYIDECKQTIHTDTHHAEVIVRSCE